jgi:hypothetical protein
MALVILRPDTSEPYLLDVQRKGTGTAGRPLELSFVVRHPRTHAPINEYLIVHDRPAHMFVVSSDLRVFDHVHPEPGGNGRLELTWQPPRPGRYHFLLDVVPRDAFPQLLESVVEVPGGTPVREPIGLSSLASAHGVTASLETAAFFAGRWERFEVKLTDTATGAPLTGWEPWLGAWGHMFAIRDGATEPMHAHPDEDSIVRTAEGTSVTFDVLFPRTGRYGVWVQVQRNGVVVTLPFSVEVQGWTVAGS